MAEVIFLQTDPTFHLVERAIRELQEMQRLRGHIVQGAHILRIERALQVGENDENDDLRYTWKSTNNFARTAGACFRMAMLEATGVSRREWPRIDAFQQNTCEGNMAHAPDPMSFHLADNRRDAKKYMSKYKQLYESSVIVQKYKEAAVGADVPLNSMMVIFRNDFTEMIRITTVVELRKTDDKVYHAKVCVLCEKNEISPGDDTQTPAFHELKAGRRDADLIAEAITRMNTLAI